MISDNKCIEIHDYVQEFGAESAIKNLGLIEESMKRYLREYRLRGLGDECQKYKKPPNILILDVENSPTMAAVWGVWKQNINMNQITEEWYMLSWSAKNLFSTEIMSDVLTPEEAIDGNDKRIMESIWEHLNNADIICGHNIVNFDVLKMNTRFVMNGMIPPSPYQVIDTLMAARKNFAFTSNKLDYLTKQFGVTRKADNGGMERWLGCMKGNPQDLLDMEEYNKQDIIATEELYLAIRPWIKTHPNLALYMDSEADTCYKCGSINILWEDDKFYYTNVNKYPVYRCNDCSSIGRGRYSAMNKEERKHITSPIAR